MNEGEVWAKRGKDIDFAALHERDGGRESIGLGKKKGGKGGTHTLLLVLGLIRCVGRV